MAFRVKGICYKCDLLKFGNKFIRSLECRGLNTGTDIQQSVSNVKTQEKGSPIAEETVETDHNSFSSPSSGHINNISVNKVPSNTRFHYPEFLPVPHIPWRNPLKEKLERQDMLSRRSQIHIPEFYVGCVMKVVKSNVHQPDKTSEFVGICIRRDKTGLCATFTLRNVVDNIGIEINYEMYDPTIRSIQVLRLERRLDEDLGYLRDAYPEYCTFPLDMKAEVRRDNIVPLNPIKVKLKPRPWFFNWHKMDYKGIENLESLLSKTMIVKHKKFVKPWEKYDLVQEYRRTIPEEEQEEIYSEVIDKLKATDMEHHRKGRK